MLKRTNKKDCVKVILDIVVLCDQGAFFYITPQPLVDCQIKQTA